MIKRLSLVGLILCGGATALAGDISSVLLDSENVFVPLGFDENDDSEAIVTGWLPSPCYKRPSGHAKVIGDDIYVDLTATKFDVENSVCILMAVPFTVPVSLGQLKPGEYRLHVNQSNYRPKLANIRVEEANSESVDNFTYAGVEAVTPLENSREVILTGTNPSDCLELEDVKMISNHKDVFAVLPIMKKVKRTCERKQVPFSYTVQVPAELDADQILLHVRSMDGRSVNKVFNNR